METASCQADRRDIGVHGHSTNGVGSASKNGSAWGEGQRGGAPTPPLAALAGPGPTVPVASRKPQWKLSCATDSGSRSLFEANPAADLVEARPHPDPARCARRILQRIPRDPSTAGFVSSCGSGPMVQL